MAFLQDIRINITQNTRALARKGFGLPLILGTTTGDGPTNEKMEGIYREFYDLTSVAQYYQEEKDEYKMAHAMFSQEPSPQMIAIYSRKEITDGDPTTKESIEDALTALNESHPGFYAIFISDRTKGALATAGNWADANKKFFFGCTSAITALDGRDSDREAYLIHSTPGKFPECAWAGQNLPKDPGSITWKWKFLNGQGEANFTLTQLNDIREKKGQTITEIGGIPVVNEGRTTSGEFIDVIRGQDWVKARMEEDLYQLFISNDKVSLDNVGIAQVESVIRTVLKQAGNRGIIAQATTESDLLKSDDKMYMYQVTVPRREDISENDRKMRKLPDVEFIYYLAGAIHEAEVKGKITV